MGKNSRAGGKSVEQSFMDKTNVAGENDDSENYNDDDEMYDDDDSNNQRMGADQRSPFPPSTSGDGSSVDVDSWGLLRWRTTEREEDAVCAGRTHERIFTGRVFPGLAFRTEMYSNCNVLGRPSSKQQGHGEDHHRRREETHEAVAAGGGGGGTGTSNSTIDEDHSANPQQHLCDRGRNGNGYHHNMLALRPETAGHLHAQLGGHQEQCDHISQRESRTNDWSLLDTVAELRTNDEDSAAVIIRMNEQRGTSDARLERNVDGATGSFSGDHRPDSSRSAVHILENPTTKAAPIFSTDAYSQQ
jgi:hypothetical protein